VRLCQAAAKPAQEGDWRGNGMAGCGDGVAAGGGVPEAVVVGGSVQVGDVLFGENVDGLKMHVWTSCRGGAGTVIRTGCGRLAVR
jgi:hypothetical protein